MKESFNELYTRLYNENFQELEEKRKKEYSKVVGILGIFALSFMIRYYSFHCKT